MDTLSFLRLVLPAEGYYCGAVIPKKGEFKTKFFDTIEELAEFADAISNFNHDAYYAVSSFIDKTRRKQHNVLKTKVIAFDLDVGKVQNSYTDKAAALTSLKNFLAATNLPRPMIVSSGAGFHIYWVLEEAIGPDQWKPIAERIKALAMQHSMVIDPTVTADHARILRPVGTKHVASGNEVKVLMEAPPIPLSAFDVYGMAHAAPQRRGLLDNLKVTQDFPLAVGHIVKAKCQQIGWAVDNQSEVSEPMWYAMLGVAAFTHDAHLVAQEWSSGHPQYSKIDTLKKLEQWKENVDAPTTCTKFEALRPGGCKGCPFAGKIGSPTRLGAQYQSVAVAPQAPDPVSSIIPIPKPFKRTSQGIKITIDDTDIDVCNFDIYPVSYGRDENLGYETVKFHWNRAHVGWTTLLLRQALLTEGHRDFPTACADQGILLSSKRQMEFFQMMLRNYMEELKKTAALTNLYGSMGWKEDFKTFVVGDTIIRQDATGKAREDNASLASGTLRTSNDMYPTAGSLDAWVNGTAVLHAADMRHHMFALGVGFAAPLFAFTGLKGMTVSLYGPTGGGKTLIQYWIQSIYGNPDRLHFAAKYTQNTLFSRLGMYNNLPMTIDEATMLADKDVGDFLYWVSQGRDKARLNRSAEEREQKTWATPVILSTNKSMAAKLISSGLDTDAQMARLLEVTVPQHKLFAKDSTAGQKIYQHLMSNYGTAGRLFIGKLVELGEEGVKARIEQHRLVFKDKYKAKFAGQERYWEQAIFLADLGSQMAAELGLIKYDHSLGTEWVLAQLGAIRRTVEEAKHDCFDLLSEYMNENADAAVTIMQTGPGKPVVDLSRIPRSEVHVRFHVWRKDPQSQFSKGTVLIDRTHFRRWLSLKGADFKTFTNDVARENMDATPKSNKAYLAKDTPIKVPQAYVLGLDLTHPRLEGLLNEADTAFNTTSFSKIAAVK